MIAENVLIADNVLIAERVAIYYFRPGQRGGASTNLISRLSCNNEPGDREWGVLEQVCDVDDPLPDHF